MRMVKLKTYSSVFIEDNIILKFKLLFNFRAPSAEFQFKLRNIKIKLHAVLLPVFDNWTYSTVRFHFKEGGTLVQCTKKKMATLLQLLSSWTARNIWTKGFGRISILVGWWFGMARTKWSYIFPKHPFCHIAVTLFIFLFKLSCWKIAGAARNWTNYVPQTAATTFAFFSFFHGTLSRAVMLFGNTWGRNMDYSARENTSDQWSSCWVRVHKGLLE